MRQSRRAASECQCRAATAYLIGATLLVAFDEFEQSMTEFVVREEANYLDDIGRARAATQQQELFVLFATVLGESPRFRSRST